MKRQKSFKHPVPRMYMGLHSKSKCRNWRECHNHVYGDLQNYCEECREIMA